MLSLDARKINATLLFVLTMSCFMQAFFVDVGFALKPFIVVTFLAMPLTLWLNYVPRKLTSFEMLFLLFALTAILRGSVSLSSVRFLRSALAIITVTMFYVCVYITAYRLPAKTITGVLLWAGVVFLVLSLLLYFMLPALGGLRDRGILRLKGTTIDPNIFVAFALPLLAVAGSSIHRRAILSPIVFCLVLICLALTYSRGGVISLGVVVVLSWVKLVLRNSRMLLLTLLLMLAIFAAWQITKPELALFHELWHRPGASSGSGRLVIWNQGLKLFSAHPLLGIGLDNFRTYSDLLFNNNQYMHNTYLEVLVENGMLGFALFAGSVVALLLHRTKQTEAEWLKISLVGQLAAVFFLSGLTLEAVYLVAALYTACALNEVRE